MRCASVLIYIDVRSDSCYLESNVQPAEAPCKTYRAIAMHKHSQLQPCQEAIIKPLKSSGVKARDGLRSL